MQLGVGILLLPLYTRYLDPREYGAAVLSILVAGFAAALVSLHIQAAIVRFTYDAPDDPHYLRRLYGTVFVFTSITSTVVFILGVIAIVPVFRIAGIPDAWLPYAFLTLTLAATRSSYEILQGILQAHHQARRYAVQQGLYFATAASITVTLMVGYSLGGLAIVIGAASTSVGFTLYAVAYVARTYGLRFDKRIIQDCLAYSISLLPNRFAGLIPQVADRVFLTSISVSTAGLYTVGYRLGEGLSYLSGGFFRAHLPWFYATMNEGEEGYSQIIRVARHTTIVIAAGAVLTALFAEEVVRIALGEAYQEAWQVVPIVVSAVVFNSVKEFWLRPLTYEKSSVKYVPIATYTFAALSVGLTAVIVPLWGMVGAAGAILIARILSSFVMAYFSVRIRNIGYPVGEIYGIAFLALGLAMFAYLPVEGLVFIKLLVAAIVVAVAGFSAREELRLLLHLARNRPVTAAS